MTYIYWINAVAMNIGCSTHAFRHLKQRFQAKGHVEDGPHSGHPRITWYGQDHYIWTTHLFCTVASATATGANTHGTHNNRISAQTVRNRLCKGGLNGRPCWLCLARHHVNRVNCSYTHPHWIRQQ